MAKKVRERTPKQIAKERELLSKRTIRSVRQDSELTFASAIKSVRKAFGMTQQDLSSRLGLSKAAIAQWEVGLALPRQGFLPTIEGVFGMKPRSLFRAFENSMVDRVLSQRGLNSGVS